MARKVVTKEEQYDWEKNFKNKKSVSNWSIALNKVSGRIELKNPDGAVLFSSLDTQSCKSQALTFYNVPLSDWE